MKKLTKNILGSLLIGSVLALVAIFSPLSPTTYAACDTSAANLSVKSGVDCAQGNSSSATLFGGSGSIFTTIVNVLLFIIGAVSVIMLIIGGIRYTVSAGDSGNVTAAKNTIMYALIGLVIAFLAFAIVNYVLTSVTAPGA